MAKRIIFEDITPTRVMLQQAAKLNEGEMLFVRKSKCYVIMKTEYCDDNEIYIWRSEHWHLIDERELGIT